MKIKGVITGATGYIGSNLLRYLLSQNWDLYIISQPEFGYQQIEDVKDQIHIVEYDNNIQTLISFFRETNPDVVFHLAAAVINNYKPEQIPILIQSNIQFGTEVLEAMRSGNTRLFVSTGSIWQNYNSNTYNPVDLYAATKEAFEKILLYYVDAFNFRAITLRIFDVYGENDKRPKLLNLVRDIANTQTRIDVSPAQQELDMVHITDVCTAYLKAYEWLQQNETIRNEVYGVFTDERIKLQDLLLLFGEILEIPVQVNFGGKPYKEREVMTPCDSLIQLPNWKPNVQLRDGLLRFKNQ
jgi:CDP-3, 6-dideoxy-D-glycero-L-glycero-4-hexulose-4-reductase